MTAFSTLVLAVMSLRVMSPLVVSTETPAKARRGSLTVRLQLRSTLGLCSSEKLEEGSMVLAMVRVLPSRVKV